jgi:cyclopropane fatty-acyl-phospholipid synthase-like methyltransferase
MSSQPYLHGFSREEQERLVRQARMAESTVFHDIDLSGSKRLLEVGSGVGAQT